MAPGIINTSAVTNLPHYQKIRESAERTTPIPRIGEVDDVANAIVFLGFKYALRARDVVAARNWLDRLNPAQHEAQYIIPWLMELAFLEGDWRRLRALFAGFRRARHVNPRVEDLARFWMGPAQPAPAA